MLLARLPTRVLWSFRLATEWASLVMSVVGLRAGSVVRVAKCVGRLLIICVIRLPVRRVMCIVVAVLDTFRTLGEANDSIRTLILVVLTLVSCRLARLVTCLLIQWFYLGPTVVMRVDLRLRNGVNAKVLLSVTMWASTLIVR